MTVKGYTGRFELQLFKNTCAAGVDSNWINGKHEVKRNEKLVKKRQKQVDNDKH